MGDILEPEQAALLVSVIMHDPDLLGQFGQELETFGALAEACPVWKFDFTRYYERTMGSPLFRRFFLFHPGFASEDLPRVKIRTNEMERGFAPPAGSPYPRPVNIDPGYLTLSKLVLASTKDHAHRIHIRDGIYGEVTLSFRKGSFRFLPWTYPDYASQGYIDFFNSARKRLFNR